MHLQHMSETSKKYLYHSFANIWVV